METLKPKWADLEIAKNLTEDDRNFLAYLAAFIAWPDATDDHLKGVADRLVTYFNDIQEIDE